VATWGPGPANFQKNPLVCGKCGGFEKKVTVFRKFSEKLADLWKRWQI
jgi:hypothetical protein